MVKLEFNENKGILEVSHCTSFKVEEVSMMRLVVAIEGEIVPVYLYKYMLSGGTTCYQLPKSLKNHNANAAIHVAKLDLNSILLYSLY